MKLTVHEIAEVIAAKNDYSKLEDKLVGSIEFDSRKITENGVFLPLKGARDGHEFIPTAFANGALITFSEQDVDFPYLLVEDCLVAFQKLAEYYLEKMKVEVIAVTGSNGKTTTKDMIAAVLGSKFPTYKTQGNHNNEIGMPYTILQMPDETEKIVLEMGMDHPGDIDFLSKLAKPSLALITLVGEAHLEFMGSRENIAKGKMGITAGLTGELIAPADPIISQFIPENQKMTRFGASGADLFITKLVEHKDYLSFNSNFMDETITIPVPGKYNATNAMLAAYVGLHYGLSETEIKSALGKVELTRNRTEWLKAANGAEILSDVYNSNPTATRLILETFQAIENPEGRKLVVLADMLELGDSALDLHGDIAQSLDFDLLDKVYLYGPLMKFLAVKLGENPKVAYFDNLELLKLAVKVDLKAEDQILLKGSNGMKLSEVIEVLTK